MSETGITDVLGHSFEPGERFERIVSLVPSLTESLFDLGDGERLVGRTDFCLHPARRLATVPGVGGPQDPDLAAIQALEPDLVLMDQEENRRADAQALLAAGVRLFVTAPRSVPDVLEMLWQLALLLDIPARAGPRLQTIERVYERVRGAAESQARAPLRLFCPLWRDPWMTFSADTYAHDLLRTCGAENLFAARRERYPSVTLEQVAERAPDLILLPSEPFAFGRADAAELAAHPALAGVPIRFVEGSLVFWPGTRLARALAQLPPLLEL